MSQSSPQSASEVARTSSSSFAAGFGILASLFFPSAAHSPRIEEARESAAPEVALIQEAPPSSMPSEFPPEWNLPHDWHAPLLPEVFQNVQEIAAPPEQDPVVQPPLSSQPAESAASEHPDIEESLKDAPKEANPSTPITLTADELRSIVQTETRTAIEEFQETHSNGSLWWKGLTLLTAFIAFQGYWRWRYRTRDDFRKKSRDLQEMFRWDSLLVEDVKFIAAYDREPKKPGEVRQLVVETARAPKESDIELETIIGPYCMDHLKRASRFCTPKDPFILDHIDKIPISYTWIRDEFFRWEFRSAARLMRARLAGDPRATRELINLRLKLAVESSLGEQAIEFIEGRDRDPSYYLIALLCEVRPDKPTPGREHRKIMVRVIADEQLPLYRNHGVLMRMLGDNPDHMSREILMMAKLAEREKAMSIDPDSLSARFKPGHPRMEKPEPCYAQHVSLMHRSTDRTPVDAQRIRELYSFDAQGLFPFMTEG